MFDIKAMWTALPDLIRFIPITIQLTVGALLIAFPLSILFAKILLGENVFWKGIVKLFLSVIRGTPVLLQMFVICSLLPFVLGKIFEKLQLNINIYDVDNKWYAYVALSLSSIAFFTEALRSSIAAVPKGQAEAGMMVGLTKRQVFRRIIFPQALATAIPVMGNIVVDLVKTTSLAFTMSVTELMGEAKIMGGMNTRYLEMFLDVFIIYLFLIGTIELLFKKLEKRIVRYRNR